MSNALEQKIIEQRNEILALRKACRKAILPLAHVSQFNKMYRPAYMSLASTLDAIDDAIDAKMGKGKP